jgi:mannose-6-phosphate isomerase-like protein (cupin superfamily)
MPAEKISLTDTFAEMEPSFGARTLDAFDGYDLRVAKVQGEFFWHQHDATDELYVIMNGTMRLQIEGREDVLLNKGDAFVIPKGTQHRTIAEEPVELLLAWPTGVPYR